METNERNDVWNRILEDLREKLQFGVLQQAKSVVEARVCGGVLTLVVTDAEAEEYFNAEINKQRLMIMSRPVAPLADIEVRRVSATPITSGP